jgi:hypothetical protein
VTSKQNSLTSRLVNCEQFRAWLREQEALAGKSDSEWSAAFPECQQAIFRRGMWYAFHEALQSLAEMSYEPPHSQTPSTQPLIK